MAQETSQTLLWICWHSSFNGWFINLVCDFRHFVKLNLWKTVGKGESEWVEALDAGAAGDRGQGRKQEEKTIISVIVVSPASYVNRFLRMHE